MDRQAILDKVFAMLKLQGSSDFEGESAAAAAMIDKLCAKYGVTVEEATIPQVLEEDHYTTGRLNDAEFRLFTSVANFYDAVGGVKHSYPNGRKVSSFHCIGTEAQQIQTKLYYEFLLDNMKKECGKAMLAERILAQVQGISFDKTGFKRNFMLAFANKVNERLEEMKIDRGDHEHKDYTLAVVNKMKFGTKKTKGASGWAAAAGGSAGSSVSLNRQTTGRQALALSGGR